MYCNNRLARWITDMSLLADWLVSINPSYFSILAQVLSMSSMLECRTWAVLTVARRHGFLYAPDRPIQIVVSLRIELMYAFVQVIRFQSIM
jgi:hypothetical protein